jgi:hypothetical protein
MNRGAAVDFKANDKRMRRQGLPANPSLHVDQQRICIEILALWLSGQPSLSPSAQRADDANQFTARIGQDVFRPARSADTHDDADIGQRLQPLGEHGPRYSRNAPADVVEATPPAQDFADHEQCPAAAENFMRTGNRAELTVACHGSLLPCLCTQRRSVFRT